MSFPRDRYLSSDGLELARLVRTGEVAPVELVEAALARIEEVNPHLNAVVYSRAEQAASEAAALTPEAIRAHPGPFVGVPFLVKNLLTFVEKHPLTAGSRLLQGISAGWDSEMTRRYGDAGVIVLGSTNTPELGLLPVTEPDAYGPTRNPWDPDRAAGGSSGGAAAAVAVGIVPIAGGSDGGGSIRVPAACCGVFGLKPTRGRTPCGPDRTETWRGLSGEHVLTRSVRDSAAMLDAVSHPDPGARSRAPGPKGTFLEAVARDPAPLRMAWTTRPFLGPEVSDEARRGIHESLELLQALGHRCEEVELPLDGEVFARDFLTLVAAETRAELEGIQQLTGREARPGRVEPETWALFLAGGALSAAELSQALRRLEVAARRVMEFLQPYDALVTPTIAFPPVPIGSLRRSPRTRRALSLLGRMRSGRLILRLRFLEEAAAKAFWFVPWTPVFNVTGQPAMSVPLFWTEEGLPMGTHFVGRFGDEETLFSLAGQLERARPWSSRRPDPSRPGIQPALRWPPPHGLDGPAVRPGLGGGRPEL